MLYKYYTYYFANSSDDVYREDDKGNVTSIGIDSREKLNHYYRILIEDKLKYLVKFNKHTGALLFKIQIRELTNEEMLIVLL